MLAANFNYLLIYDMCGLSSYVFKKCLLRSKSGFARNYNEFWWSSELSACIPNCLVASTRSRSCISTCIGQSDREHLWTHLLALCLVCIYVYLSFSYKLTRDLLVSL